MSRSYQNISKDRLLYIYISVIEFVFVLVPTLDIFRDFWVQTYQGQHTPAFLNTYVRGTLLLYRLSLIRSKKKTATFSKSIFSYLYLSKYKIQLITYQIKQNWMNVIMVHFCIIKQKPNFLEFSLKMTLFVTRVF